jgi:D-glycero-D-manno-heptose 1,7-bisphosphate phosphatase
MSPKDWRKTTVQRAVFLDRDGVLNRSLLRAGRPYAPVSLDEFEILPGVAESLLKLREAGYVNIVATNQPDLATGRQSRATLDAMHRELNANLALDAILVCDHVDEDQCTCRKPLPGMLVAAAANLRIDLSKSWMVGDRWRDIAAGQAAGCRCCFIDHGYDERYPDLPYYSVLSLPEAIDVILERSS